MEKLSLCEIPQSELSNISIIPGQLICCIDTGNFYRDLENNRVHLGSDIITVDSLPLAPIANKIYLLKPNKLFVFDGEKWYQLNIDQSIFDNYVTNEMFEDSKNIQNNKLQLAISELKVSNIVYRNELELSQIEQNNKIDNIELKLEDLKVSTLGNVQEELDKKVDVLDGEAKNLTVTNELTLNGIIKQPLSYILLDKENILPIVKVDNINSNRDSQCMAMHPYAFLQSISDYIYALPDKKENPDFLVFSQHDNSGKIYRSSSDVIAYSLIENGSEVDDVNDMNNLLNAGYSIVNGIPTANYIHVGDLPFAKKNPNIGYDFYRYGGRCINEGYESACIAFRGRYQNNDLFLGDYFASEDLSAVAIVVDINYAGKHKEQNVAQILVLKNYNVQVDENNLANTYLKLTTNTISNIDDLNTSSVVNSLQSSTVINGLFSNSFLGATYNPLIGAYKDKILKTFYMITDDTIATSHLIVPSVYQVCSRCYIYHDINSSNYFIKDSCFKLFAMYGKTFQNQFTIIDTMDNIIFNKFWTRTLTRNKLDTKYCWATVMIYNLYDEEWLGTLDDNIYLEGESLNSNISLIEIDNTAVRNYTCAYFNLILD